MAVKEWKKKDVEAYFEKNNAKAKVRTIFSKMKIDISTAKPFEDLTPIKKRIVVQAFKEEDRLNDLEEYIFLFENMNTKVLPKSYWENILNQQIYPDNIKFNQQQIENFKRVIKKIKTIENNIIKIGYKMNKPILIRYFEDEKIGIDGGHHRLQAIRNLIQNKKLNPSAKIPCLIILRKKDFNYKKINFKGIIDYSHQLDDLIAGRDYTKYKEIFKGFIHIEFVFLINHIFRYKYVFLYIKRINNDIYVDFGISSIRYKQYVPIVLEFINKKAKSMNIIVVESIDKEFNVLLNKMKEKHLIREIKKR